MMLHHVKWCRVSYAEYFFVALLLNLSFFVVLSILVKLPLYDETSFICSHDDYLITLWDSLYNN